MVRLREDRGLLQFLIAQRYSGYYFIIIIFATVVFLVSIYSDKYSKWNILILLALNLPCWITQTVPRYIRKLYLGRVINLE